MAKKGTTCRKYTEAFKLKAIHLYENGGRSYDAIAEELGMTSATPLKMWVKQIRNGESVTDKRNTYLLSTNGCSQQKFQSVEEERDYLKAQVDYLKKQYPNLHGEGKYQK
ncbi:transposase [Bacillus sp. AC79A.1]|uniref:transposase n=1 Tax=Bacillus wiedmannii TaxID=1890302 RepID=UPI000BFDF99E|nr:transposase [Bacillus wiedmannii]PHF04986.1 hypothetical protein COF74_27075 [Bacillus wiedmannii]